MKTLKESPRYKISEDGDVYNTLSGKFVSKILTGIPQYYYVNIRYEDGSTKLRRLHRLVAETYIDNPNNYNIVDHIDRDPLNNHYTNLRWVTRSENGRNTKTNVRVILSGKEHLLVDICKDIPVRNISPSSVYGIVRGLDLSIDYIDLEFLGLFVDERLKPKPFYIEDEPLWDECNGDKDIYIEKLESKKRDEQLQKKIEDRDLKYNGKSYLTYGELYNDLRQEVDDPVCLGRFKYLLGRGDDPLDAITRDDRRTRLECGNTLRDLHDKVGVGWPYNITRTRYFNLKNKSNTVFTMENIFTTPPRIRFYTYKGEKYSRKQLVEILGLNKGEVSRLVNYNYNLKDYCRDRGVGGWESIEPVFSA